jgi:hypothetical protein
VNGDIKVVYLVVRLSFWTMPTTQRLAYPQQGECIKHNSTL